MAPGTIGGRLTRAESRLSGAGPSHVGRGLVRANIDPAKSPDQYFIGHAPYPEPGQGRGRTTQPGFGVRADRRVSCLALALRVRDNPATTTIVATGTGNR